MKHIIWIMLLFGPGCVLTGAAETCADDADCGACGSCNNGACLFDLTCASQRGGGGALTSTGAPAPCPPVSPGEIVWRARAPMPTPRQEAAIAVVRGIIYTIGGAIGGANAEVEAYDPHLDRWYVRASLPRRLRDPSAAAIGDVIYVLGGTDGLARPTYSDAMFAYDTHADVWTELPTVPWLVPVQDEGIQNQYLTARALDGLLYVCFFSSLQPTGGCRTYDPTTEAWTSIEEIPIITSRYVSTVHQGELWVAPSDGHMATINPMREMASIDPSVGRWRSRPSVLDRLGFSLVDANDQLYAVGATSLYQQQQRHVMASVLRYDEVADVWLESTPLGLARTIPGVAEVDGRIYAIGGSLVPLGETLPTGVVEEGCVP